MMIPENIQSLASEHGRPWLTLAFHGDEGSCEAQFLESEDYRTIFGSESSATKFAAKRPEWSLTPQSETVVDRLHGWETRLRITALQPVREIVPEIVPEVVPEKQEGA
jgi:hypothetical protein